MIGAAGMILISGLGLLLVFLPFSDQAFSDKNLFHFLVHYYSSRSSIDILLSSSVASIVSGLMLTSYALFILNFLDEEKLKSYSIKHFVMANISFVFAIVSMIVTISACNLKFQSPIEYIAIVIEFFTVQSIFQHLVLKYSFSQTLWTFLTGSLATLLGYYISFNLPGELISSDFKIIIGSSIFSTICTLVYLIKSEKNGIKSIW
jgi:hypothetical protein